MARWHSESRYRLKGRKALARASAYEAGLASVAPHGSTRPDELVQGSDPRLRGGGIGYRFYPGGIGEGEITPERSVYHNLTLGLQGGKAGEVYHVDDERWHFNELHHAQLAATIGADAGAWAAYKTALYGTSLSLGVGSLSTVRNIVFDGGADAVIRQNTADASDNRAISLAGGGTTGSTRGGDVSVIGNEYGFSYSGVVRLRSGVPATTVGYDGCILFEPYGAIAGYFNRARDLLLLNRLYLGSAQQVSIYFDGVDGVLS